MKITYKNSTNQMTLQDAIELYEVCICTVVTDGKDVTFMAEKEPIRQPAK